MTKRMLIDATHAEETRVVVLDGTRLEDFDVETSTKRQLKGNIYLAKVVRVEPSLQAAFVEYGGNRHGFLAFSEIHPDYYQIPVADRQRLLEMQAEDARREEEEEDLELALTQATDNPGMGPLTVVPAPRMPAEQQAEPWSLAATPSLLASPVWLPPAEKITDIPLATVEAWAKPGTPPLAAAPVEPPKAASAVRSLAIPSERVVEGKPAPRSKAPPADQDPSEDESNGDDVDAYGPNGDGIEVLPPPESVGGGDQDTSEDHRERRMPPRFLRNYKIQEVIRRRQILLVQVVKEERGTKGAALTTYLSLAGRFGVLMPNSPRGGGISRKITSATDRRRLKEVMAELDIPRGMGMIVRTAGANRPKPEIKRDCEYLLRLWDDIRDHTMKSVAPALIYEEASLIKRAIRDVYSRDIDEILVDGEEGWRAAHDFMRMLMPSHAKKVQLWRDGGQPLFARNQVEAQLDGMLMPTVQLRSGGYLVINQAEALVAIDVNSGRSTRERNIEETALRTNLEAADEVARQLRLRDLAGLIVIDFIDMESKRHNAMVERRIKEALKNDRARIQVGHISHFGLLEMSRQRLRPSLAETSFIPCPHCGGTGHVRSTENAAIHVLRGVEDEGGKRRSAEIAVYVSTPVALYLLNHKRERLREIELRYAMRVIIAADDTQIAPQFRIEKVRTRSPDEAPIIMAPAAMAGDYSAPAGQFEEPDDDEDEVEAIGSEDDDDDADASDEQSADAAGSGDDADRRRKRRRRRRRGSRRDDFQSGEAASGSDDPAITDAAGIDDPDAGALAAGIPDAELSDEPVVVAEAVTTAAEPEVPERAVEPAETAAEEATEGGEAVTSPDDDPRNRRRGRRGGRRRRRDNEGELSPFAIPGADQPELQPVYAGPTPADPFGGRAFDIFDVMDQAERVAESRPAPRSTSAVEIVTMTAPDSDSSASAPAESEPEPIIPAPVQPTAAQLEAGMPAPEPAVPDGSATEPEAAPAEPQAIADISSASQPKLEIVNTPAPEPAAELMPDSGEVGADPHSMPAHDTSPELEIPEPPPAAPAIKPILVGAEAGPPTEKKRGWWRR
jgi:ribonuclease E